jgi:hypothetical protein
LTTARDKRVERNFACISLTDGVCRDQAEATRHFRASQKKIRDEISVPAATVGQAVNEERSIVEPISTGDEFTAQEGRIANDGIKTSAIDCENFGKLERPVKR